jgi:PKD repeat protein
MADDLQLISRYVLPKLNSNDDLQLICRGEINLDFSANLRTGIPPHGVDFTNLTQYASGPWLWSFGDGNTSTDENPEHIYTEEGEFDVTLTHTGLYNISLTRQGYVVVDANLSVSPRVGNSPLKVIFSIG